MEKKEKKIDFEKLNRVLYVLGIETIKSLAKLNVFIHGLSGLGVEIGKILNPNPWYNSLL